MSEEVFKTTCRKYVVDRCLQATHGMVLSSQTQATIETRAVLNAIMNTLICIFLLKIKKKVNLLEAGQRMSFTS